MKTIIQHYNEITLHLLRGSRLQLGEKTTFEELQEEVDVVQYLPLGTPTTLIRANSIQHRMIFHTSSPSAKGVAARSFVPQVR